MPSLQFPVVTDRVPERTPRRRPQFPVAQVPENASNLEGRRPIDSELRAEVTRVAKYWKQASRGSASKTGKGVGSAGGDQAQGQWRWGEARTDETVVAVGKHPRNRHLDAP